MDIMLSALQHYVFCPRQCALIHLEQIWDENVHTVAGKLLHENAHEADCRMRDGIKIVTNLEISSNRLHLHGRADVVEFHKIGLDWKPYPVEYKKGHPYKDTDADDVQLCAQALCLEEMLGTSVDEGALYYGAVRKRKSVYFDELLRKRTEGVILSVRALLESGKTPPVEKALHCDFCSLNTWCLPTATSDKASVYIKRLCEEAV